MRVERNTKEWRRNSNCTRKRLKDKELAKKRSISKFKHNGMRNSKIRRIFKVKLIRSIKSY